jgi:molybdopterin synthase sulfur carrier subunit
MISLRILCFAQAREKLGFAEKTILCEPTATPRDILVSLAHASIPDAASTWRVALDHEYAGWNEPIGDAAEMALLPPVSGG